MARFHGRYKAFVYFAFSTFLFFGIVRGSLADEWEKVVGAAKKEGKVVVSVPASAKLRKQMEKVFEERFDGVDLELVPGRSMKKIRRIAEEFKSGVRYFDVQMGGSPPIIIGLVWKKLVDPFGPYMVLSEVKDPKNWWAGHAYADKGKRYAYNFVAFMTKNLWYNANLVKPDEIGSLEDLLNPKWKGKIGFYDPRKPGAGASMWSHLWDVKGEDYLKKLVQQEVQFTRNRRVLGESLSKGKLAITVGVTYYSLIKFIKAGLPIKPMPTFKGATYPAGGAGSMAIIKDPPHPNATKVFVNWFLGKEGQEVFGKAMGQPTRRLDVDTTWIHKFGYVPAKDGISVEKYEAYMDRLEERIKTVRRPATKFARKVLK